MFTIRNIYIISYEYDKRKFYIYFLTINNIFGIKKIRRFVQNKIKQSVCKNVFLCCKMLHTNPQYQKNNAKCITTHIIIDAM